MVFLKQLLVSNSLSRSIVRLHPADVFKGFSHISRRMIHEDVYPELFKKDDAQNRYFIVCMAGVKKEDAKVSFKLQGFNELKIKGDGVTKDFKNIKYKGKFNLPRNVTTNSIVAEMKDGELKVNLPKGEERREKFEVKVD